MAQKQSFILIDHVFAFNQCSSQFKCSLLPRPLSFHLCSELLLLKKQSKFTTVPSICTSKSVIFLFRKSPLAKMATGSESPGLQLCEFAWENLSQKKGWDMLKLFVWSSSSSTTAKIADARLCFFISIFGVLLFSLPEGRGISTLFRVLLVGCVRPNYSANLSWQTSTSELIFLSLVRLSILSSWSWFFSSDFLPLPLSSWHLVQLYLDAFSRIKSESK